MPSFSIEERLLLGHIPCREKVYFEPGRANLLIGAFSFSDLFVRPNSFIINTEEAPSTWQHFISAN
jgi:hypothetical protein